ncbi:MAG: twin-arginine translocase subunit TatC [Anaerolineaceae bacterium]|nr:twin-arginine translocase subunit TatC [Anaerolineaceae bacterium]
MEEMIKKSNIWGHLGELRKRLFYTVIGLVICIGISLFFSEALIQYLSRPVGGIEKLQAIEVTETVSAYMRVALLSGFILSLPWTLVQLMIFVVPGLKQKERKWLFSAIPFATLLFIGGVLFSFFIMLPPALNFMTEFLSIETNIRLKNYLDFLINLLFWVGISFETPLIFFILSKLGIVNGKMLLKGWKIAIIVIAILAAVITPTGDPVNMAILMAPLLILYILSILLAFVARGKNKSLGE